MIRNILALFGLLSIAFTSAIALNAQSWFATAPGNPPALSRDLRRYRSWLARWRAHVAAAYRRCGRAHLRSCRLRQPSMPGCSKSAAVVMRGRAPGLRSPQRSTGRTTAALPPCRRTIRSFGRRQSRPARNNRKPDGRPRGAGPATGSLGVAAGLLQDHEVRAYAIPARIGFDEALVEFDLVVLISIEFGPGRIEQALNADLFTVREDDSIDFMVSPSRVVGPS